MTTKNRQHDSDKTKFVIQVDGLSKRFGKDIALDNLNLNVKVGEIHGFLGPNGAGKSTTIRILLGLLRKNSGTIRVFGLDPWRDSVQLHRRLAYVPGDVNLWPNLTGGEAIDLFGKLRGGLDVQRRAMLIEQFKLDPTKKARTYSKGNRQKVALIAALASDVELYIMDEPTSGLDPLMEMTFQECVRDLKTKGKTVLLSSHIMAEAEVLCDRITIIREGKDVQSGSLSDMRHLTRLTITVTTTKKPEGISSVSGVYDVTSVGNKTQFEVDPASLDRILEKLTHFGVTDLVCNPPSLETLFMRHYNEDSRTATQSLGKH